MTTLPYTITIQNIVATSNLHRKYINLNEIVARCKKAEYKHDQFPGLIYRLEKPKATALIFSSGQMVCTGAKSTKDCYEAIEKIKKDVIEKIFGKQHQQSDITIQNIVASCDFYGYIDLERLDSCLPRSRYRVMYEPDQFPAGIIRDIQKVEIRNKSGEKVGEDKSVFLGFTSGKVITSACKSEESLRARTADLYETLFNLNLLQKDEEKPINS